MVAVSVSSIRPRLQSGRQPPRHQIIPALGPPAAIIRTTGARGREAGYPGPSRGHGGGNELLILILWELGRPTKVRMDHLFRRRVSFVLAKKMDKGIPRRQSSAVLSLVTCYTAGCYAGQYKMWISILCWYLSDMLSIWYLNFFTKSYFEGF